MKAKNNMKKFAFENCFVVCCASLLLLCENHNPLISRSCLMSVQILWLEETRANHSVKICLVLSNLSSGTTRTRTGRRRLSGRTTGPCWPTSVHQLEVTTKTRPTRHTASSLSGGWRASTHSEDNTVEDTHTHTQEIMCKLSCADQTVSLRHRCGLWWNIADIVCLYHQYKHKWRSIFICSVCTCFFFIK